MNATARPTTNLVACGAGVQEHASRNLAQLVMAMPARWQVARCAMRLELQVRWITGLNCTVSLKPTQSKSHILVCKPTLVRTIVQQHDRALHDHAQSLSRMMF